MDIDPIGPLCPAKTYFMSPLSISNTLAFPSVDVITTSLLSGLNPTFVAILFRPNYYSLINRPVSALCNLTVWSFEPVNTNLLLLLIATEVMGNK